MQHRVTDRSSLIVTTVETLTLTLIPPSTPVSLWPHFSGHLLSLDDGTWVPGFDLRCSLKNLVCTYSLALIMPGPSRKILPIHLPLAPGIQDRVTAHFQGHPTETP